MEKPPRQYGDERKDPPMAQVLDRNLHIRRIDTYVDPTLPRERAIITHGHADHARSGHQKVLATPDTIAIMQTRYGPDCAGSFQPLEFGQPLRIDDVTITLYPAGHILGSAQVLIEQDGQRVVVTGDYKRLPDKTAQPFELVPCDLLVTEATFGLPVFQHPHPNRQTFQIARRPPRPRPCDRRLCSGQGPTGHQPVARRGL
ncbi:MAG: MBL fold metallo-hydrolase [Pelagibacterium sp.]|uniref:MBL fold metallo-hydrolase n=1 Tax=Pelagibacterium sp. TaxID=1967288 RepID=UPI0032EE5BAA